MLLLALMFDLIVPGLIVGLTGCPAVLTVFDAKCFSRSACFGSKLKIENESLKNRTQWATYPTTGFLTLWAFSFKILSIASSVKNWSSSFVSFLRTFSVQIRVLEARQQCRIGSELIRTIPTPVQASLASWQSQTPIFAFLWNCLTIASSILSSCLLWNAFQFYFKDFCNQLFLLSFKFKLQLS